jgi:hypothetical protein
MPRFLSPDWFSRAVAPRPGGDDPTTVIEQVVRDTPDGEVRYLVVFGKDWARVEQPTADHPRPDLTLTSSWDTACAIAQGHTSTQRALLEGKLRIAGAVTRLAIEASDLGGLDPLPSGLRENTTYE